MGQQQLLLLVLGTIIVAVSIAVAINILISRSGAITEQYINDTINDCIRIGQLAQAWAKKPTELGGGGWSFSGFKLSNIGFPESTSYAKYQVIPNHDSLIVIGRTITGHTVEISVNHYEISKPKITKPD